MVVWCVIFLRGTVGASRGGRDGAARRRRLVVWSAFQGKLGDVCSGASITRGAEDASLHCAVASIAQ